MPTHTCCPGCGRVGLGRVEYVIQGQTVVKAWYCGACEHEWQEPPVKLPPVPLTNRKQPVTRTLKGK